MWGGAEALVPPHAGAARHDRSGRPIRRPPRALRLFCPKGARKSLQKLGPTDYRGALAFLASALAAPTLGERRECREQ